jgi:AAA15 family ATPase/GTPase
MHRNRGRQDAALAFGGGDMRIESLEIHNFKSLQNVSLTDLPGMAVFVGRNGVGKTTLFDVFGFVKKSSL